MNQATEYRQMVWNTTKKSLVIEVESTIVYKRDNNNVLLVWRVWFKRVRACDRVGIVEYLYYILIELGTK